ncbi:MAG: aminopeptidase P family N-terminal domain-containing protein, partial [Gemmatimonadaceae bacterium]
MSMNRRRFLQASALGTGALATTEATRAFAGEATRDDTSDDTSADLPAVIRALKPMTAGVVPITDNERKQRIARAQQLMGENKMDAIFMEGATSCFYFTGMLWGQSERTFGVVIPAVGKLAYVCPGFEEDRARELLKPVFGDEV